MEATRRFSGAKLRSIRHECGWTQAELARQAGVRERQIIRWENEQNEPRLDAISVLASATGRPLDAFFSDAQEVGPAAEPFRGRRGRAVPAAAADGQDGAADVSEDAA